VYNENTLGCWLHWRHSAWRTRRSRQGAVLPAATSGLRLSAAGLRLWTPHLERMPARLDSSRRKLCALSRPRGWRLGYIERLPARLHDTGWELRTV
jgi:hypothetical protein